MIHVCYSLYDKDGTYSKFVGASMCSVFENTREPVTIHILHDETLTELNRRRFIELTEHYAQTIEFHRATLNAEVNELMKTFTLSPASLYRLQMGDLLSPTVDRAIYFDADTIIELDVKELWDEIGDEDFFGAVLDAGVTTEHWQTYKRFPIITEGHVRRDDYLNAGVLIFNLKKLRSIKNFNRMMIESYHDAPNFFVAHDQDLLNYFYGTQYKKLPNRYNLQLVMERRMGLRKPARGGGCYHYICHSLSARSRDEFDRLFWYYFIKTPWFDEKFFLKAIEDFQAAAATQQMNLMKALYTCRQKIFWAPECLKDRLLDQLKALGIDDAIFLSNGEDELEPTGGYGDLSEKENPNVLDLIARVEAAPNDGRTFFCLSSYYHTVRGMLKGKGYEEGKDFVDARKLLPEYRGTYMLDSFDNVIRHL